MMTKLSGMWTFRMCVLLLLGSAVMAAPPTVDITVINTQTVAFRPVSIFLFELDVRVQVTNNGATANGLQGTVQSVSPILFPAVPDSMLSFGDVPPGATVWSTDTFTVRWNRTRPFSLAGLLFDFTGQPLDAFADAGRGKTVTVGETVVLDGTGSYDLQKGLLTYAWALSCDVGSPVLSPNANVPRPQFTMPAGATTCTATLIVNNGSQNSDPSRVIISTIDTAPIGDADPNQTVNLGDTVKLDTSGSTDFDGDPLTYLWEIVTKPSGSAATLSATTAIRPNFVADLAGEYKLKVTATGNAVSGTDEVVISTINTPPVSNAGFDQEVASATEVQLDGSGSTDFDGDLLSYMWSFTWVPAGSSVSSASLDDSTGVQPRFTPDVDGAYILQLIVEDPAGTQCQIVDTVVIQAGSAGNLSPVSQAGPDQAVGVSALVTLDGTASFDPNSGSPTYLWSIVGKPAGSAASITGAATVNPTFTTDVSGDYVAQLLVFDTNGEFSQADTVLITTTAEGARPVADSGVYPSPIPVSAATPLDGSGSADADGGALVSYFWAVLAKPAGATPVLSNPAIESPTFTPDLAGLYVVQLIVIDDEGWISFPSTSAIVATANNAPVASAGTDQPPPPVLVGSPVTLDGSGSFDPDGTPLAGNLIYDWSITTAPAGSAVTTASLSSTSAIMPTFTPDVAGSYTAQLVVNDGFLNSAPDAVDITATAPNVPPVVPAPSFTSFRNTLAESSAFSVPASVPKVTFTGTLNAGVIDPDGPLPPAFSLSTATAGATVTVEANGNFSYLPPAGFTGASDTFTFNVTDGVSVVPQTATINLVEEVWYVKNNAAPGGLGRSTDPFDTLAEAATAAGVGDYIHVQEGDGTSTGQNVGITLQNNQRLIGEGVALVLNDGSNNITLFPAGNQPTIHGASPGVTATNASAEIRGFNIVVNAIDDGISVGCTGAGTHTVDVSNNTLAGAQNGVRITNGGCTYNLNILNNTISTAGNDGVQYVGNDASNATIVIQSNSFLNSNGDHVQIAVNGTANANVTLGGPNVADGNTMNANTAVLGSGITLSSGAGAGGFSGTLTYLIQNNNIQNPAAAAINANLSSTSTAGIRYMGTIANNTVGTSGVGGSGGFGIQLTTNGAGTSKATVSNNSVLSWDGGNALSLTARSGSNRLDAVVTGNTFLEPNPVTGNTEAAIEVASGAVSGDTTVICADIQSNSFNVPSDPPFGDMYYGTLQSGSVLIPSYGGTANNQAQIQTFIQNNNTGSPTVNVFNFGGPVQGTTAGACN